MERSLSSIIRCVNWLTGRVVNVMPNKKYPESIRRYSNKGIKDMLIKSCGTENISSVSDETLWNKFFMANEYLKNAMEHRRIHSIEELFFYTDTYFIWQSPYNSLKL